MQETSFPVTQVHLYWSYVNTIKVDFWCCITYTKHQLYMQNSCFSVEQQLDFFEWATTWWNFLSESSSSCLYPLLDLSPEGTSWKARQLEQWCPNLAACFIYNTIPSDMFFLPSTCSYFPGNMLRNITSKSTIVDVIPKGLYDILKKFFAFIYKWVFHPIDTNFCIFSHHYFFNNVKKKKNQDSFKNKGFTWKKSFSNC